jgi:hypothetical protein
MIALATPPRNHPMDFEPVFSLFMSSFLPPTFLLIASLTMFGQAEIKTKMTRMRSREIYHRLIGMRAALGLIKSSRPTPL